MKRPVHVAVVGGSGSGKTWIAEKLTADLAPHAVRLSLDDFYRDLSSLPMEERERANFDDPAALDWEIIRAAIGRMRTGSKIDLPLYDFATHARKSGFLNFTTPPLVIWDGLWLLHHDWLRKQFAVSIFVDCDPEERFRRRAERDVRERGRTLESIRCQFFGHVQPMHDRFVEPQRRLVQITLRSPANEAEIALLVHRLLKKCRLEVNPISHDQISNS